MVAFQNDYIAGAHPEILKKLTETNLESLPGYGSDHYCESAKEKIKAACGCPEAEVEFLVGGTQTNMIIVSTMLREYEGVVAATTGHVNVHESGAIEYSGHKVLTIPQKNGKIEAAGLRHFLEVFYADGTQEHMVFPGMVYISHPTEYGTLYSKEELENIAAVCHEYKMPLFLDGARLGYGLMSYDTDVTLQDIARICDVFYIGGTKVGALCGEAVVFTKGNEPAHFENRIKKRGALLAKGRLLGIQFDTLFTDDLYFKIGRHAIDMAEKMKEIVREKGYEFFIDSPTNQQFVILKNSDMERIAENVVFSVWEPVDADHTAVRFATSWATTDEDLAALKKAL
ncbi:MAG: aminotransferase class I/II-fold pyridoxal phosphate-dependent enzyme [Lachnospiraceae bacterium]|nr:aminotransferase class I/II-fold pyridoxal phosphate-dependent enzyme [Lachnospiraceae bacterium]